MNKNHEIAFFENRTAVCVRGREGEERERGNERGEKERWGGERERKTLKDSWGTMRVKVH